LELGLDVPRSISATDLAAAESAGRELGFPVIVRASFTLGGAGGGIVYHQGELLAKAQAALEMSPIHQILLEESILGWKEYELEVMRDRKDNFVVVCPIENIDPMGVHTGDSVTVAPAQTLSDREYQEMRDDARRVVSEVGVETGGCNVQFAVNPKTGRRVVVEINPRVSRSSALASKATGFPIAKIAAKLAVGYTLDEIANDITKATPACFEPAIDYVVTKVPRFAVEKFGEFALDTAMKSVGEVMAVGRTFKESLQKALRGLEGGLKGFESARAASEEDLMKGLATPSSARLGFVKSALERGMAAEEIAKITGIDPWFLDQMGELVLFEARLARDKMSAELMREAKRLGFSDAQIARIRRSADARVRARRHALGVRPAFDLIDTCAGEFESKTPYFYSTYAGAPALASAAPGKSVRRAPKSRKVVILGSGPNRIGQGIEFDYCCVQACRALREMGHESVMINCNPETVSTDYDTSDRLYFEPLTLEDVLEILDFEKPLGVVAQFGGQTPLNLARPLAEAGVKILGTQPRAIDLAEDRRLFGRVLKSLKLPAPQSGIAQNPRQALAAARRIGYPVMVRPSYVLGGRAM
ncbi:MAG: carbamoyl-phosphate synthase large subunit, partial [Elusimicrobia bacterium]|nr:carbamoyl-phosphate synthase large subunit [Elusimicrobiota bacterium]